MNKRTFLKLSTGLFTGGMLMNFPGCAPEREPLKNWAGNLTYGTGNVHYPETVDEVTQLVKDLKKLRALGSRHSFNKIADSNENQVSLQKLNKVLSLDKDAMTVAVGPGATYGSLCGYLHENGFALHNLASLPHISVAGSVATATHGSGVANGNLATGVSAVEFVNAAGEVVVLRKGKDADFNGAVVGLGALGIVTKVTLDLQPAFLMRQFVYRNLPMSAMENNFEEIMSAGYSVSLFTDWRNSNINEVWIKLLADGNGEPPVAGEFFGASPATRDMHPVEDQSAANCTPQMGVVGPWYERLPHFKMGFQPSTGKELQSEYFVPRERGFEALMAMEKLSARISPHLFISEIRSVAADELWMSPCYKADCVAVHTTWKQDWDTVIKLIPEVEKALEPFNPRPHWGKLFTMEPSLLRRRYERLNDFRALASRHDPEGKFRNEFLEVNLFR